MTRAEKKFVQLVSAALALAFVAALILPPDASRPDTLGARVFRAECARCHGANGDGGIGPRLADGAVRESFPTRRAQLELVSAGRADMPSFSQKLTAGEIAAVVDCTRLDLDARP